MNQAEYNSTNGVTSASSNMSHYESVPIVGGGQSTSMSQQSQQSGGASQQTQNPVRTSGM